MLAQHEKSVEQSVLSVVYWGRELYATFNHDRRVSRSRSRCHLPCDTHQTETE
jgi:hypothetical protein